MTSATETAAVVTNRHSPCIGICRLDAATGWCEGCGRTGTEIARWIDAPDAERLAVFEALPKRLTRVGMETRVLPWTADELIERIATEARLGKTGWSVGKLTAAGGLSLPPGVPDRVTVSAAGVEIHGADRALRVLRHEKLRGFGDVPADRVIGLGLPKGRAVMPSVTAVADLGPDTTALLSGDLHHLVDLASGAPTLRIALRATDTDSAAVLSSVVGTPPADAAAGIADRLAARPVVLVAETILTRIETRTSADRLPALLAGFAAPASIAAPAGLVPAWAAPMLYGVRPGA